MDKEVTYYKFYSEIRSFLGKLKNKPLNTEPSKFLQDNGFDKKKLIHALIKRGILKRKESVKDPTNSEETQAMYYVKYSVVKEGFEDKIKKMFNEYFKKNINEMEQRKIYLTETQFKEIAKMLIREEGEAGGATTTFSVGADTSRGDMGYDVPAFGKSKNKNRKEKGTNTDFFKDSMVRKPGFSMERLEEGESNE